MVTWNFRQAHLQDTYFERPWFCNIFFHHDRFQGKFHDRFHDRQTPPTNWYSLRHIVSNQIIPYIFRELNRQWSSNMVHSHFTLCLRTLDYKKRLSQHPWYYGLWMRAKGPRHYKVTALDSCVKWPLEPLFYHTQYPEMECCGLEGYCLITNSQIIVADPKRLVVCLNRCE